MCKWSERALLVNPCVWRDSATARYFRFCVNDAWNVFRRQFQHCLGPARPSGGEGIDTAKQLTS
eukprot:3793687-Lingulodinium_polyedra.AAC.1